MRRIVCTQERMKLIHRVSFVTHTHYNVNTKMQLTEYFAKRTLEMALAEEHPVVVTWGSECTATYTDKSYMRSDHDEKDTELILHAADATRSGAKSINIRKSFKCANGASVTAVESFWCVCNAH